MRKSKFSPEVVDRAIRMVFDAKDQYASCCLASRMKELPVGLLTRFGSEATTPGIAVHSQLNEIIDLTDHLQGFAYDPTSDPFRIHFRIAAKKPT